MIPAIKDFISNMFSHTTKQQDVLETIDVTSTAITTEILPTLDDMINIYDSVDLKSNKSLKVMNQLSHTGSSDNKALLVAYKTFFNEILTNIPLLVNLIKAQLPKVMTDTTMTYKQAAIMRFCSDLTSMTMFFLDLCYVSIMDKARSSLSKKKLAEVDEGMKTFAVLFTTYNKNIQKMIKDLSKVSGEVVTRSESDVVNDIRAKSSGELVNLPVTKGFLGNPLYTIGMWMVDRQMAKIDALKDKKKLLEVRLMELRLEANREPSEKVSKMVQYYEDQVDNIEYKIRKIKED